MHVNPSAAICDGFLKGYCSDGDEVRIQLKIHCTVYKHILVSYALLVNLLAILVIIQVSEELK